MRVKRSFLLFVVMLLVGVSEAQASWDEAWTHRAEVVAGVYWGASTPPCGHPSYQYIGLDGKHGGFAYVGQCKIQIDPSYSWTWATACTAIVHEWGHLFGHGHEPGTVMDADTLIPPPACMLLSPANQLTYVGKEEYSQYTLQRRYLKKYLYLRHRRMLHRRRQLSL